MKLFFKHLARSIVKKPLQPIILVFTLTLAIAVSIFSLTMRSALDEEIQLGQAVKYGNSQITIGLSGDASSRFMFAKDAETLLDGEGVAVGTFELPLTMGEEKRTVFGVAVDFTEIGKVFDFTFIEYGEVTPTALGYSAFVTQSFAEKNGLRLGEDFTVTAFGEEKTYTVSGIARQSFIGNYEIMVDITGVIRLMTDGSPLLSALGDEFKPCSTIFVRLNDSNSISSVIETLQADGHFTDKVITDVSKAILMKSNVDSLGYVIDVSSILASLLSASVTFCCFYIIGAERTEENYTFALSGAKPWLLNLMQYAEIFFYWLISAGLGCLLTVPMTKWLFVIAGFRYASAKVKFLQSVFGAGILLFVSLATVAMFIGSQKLKRNNKPETQAENKVVLFALLCASGLNILAFIAPMGIRFWLYIVLSVSMCFFLFVAMPALMKWLAAKLNASRERRFFTSYQLKGVALRYALKNIFSVKILHNISRLVAVLTCILMTSCLMVGSAFGNVANTYTFFGGDYVVMNATESCAEKVAQCATVQDSVRVFLGENEGARMVSAESVAGLSPKFDLQQMPKGNQAILASGEAKKRSIKIGDTFTANIDGKAVELVVLDIVDSGIPFILFDCEYFGMSYNMMVIKGNPDASNGALIQELTDKTVLELAVVLSIEDLFEEKLVTVQICLNLGLIFLAITTAFACVGIIDNLYESYRARREEFHLFACSGMSEKVIRRMKLWEIVLTFGFGVALGMVGFVVMAFASNTCFHTFGFETLINLWTVL